MFAGRRKWRRRMPGIEGDGEWELERLLLEWGKSGLMMII